MNMLADGERQGSVSRGTEGGGDLVTSDLNQTNILRLPSAFRYCQVCGCCFNQPLQRDTGHFHKPEGGSKKISFQTGIFLNS